MAITTQGYDGEAHEIDEVGWAQIAGFYGSSYGVAGLDGAPDQTAGRVTTVASAERTVAVAPMIAFGHGVRDRSDTTVNVQLPAVAVGLVRWFLVAVRRNWQTNTTTIAALPSAQASQVIPSQRLTNPGVQDDQPLALVQVTGGQSIPTAIVDLRVWSGHAGLVAASQAALAYLERLGTQVTIGTKTWTRLLSSTGSPTWASHEHAASDITTGTLAGDRIPNLSADKVTSGKLNVQRLPPVPADLVATGVLSLARIPRIPKNWLVDEPFHSRTTGVTVGLGGTTRRVNFPSGMFSGAPVVHVSMVGAPANIDQLEIGLTGVTSTWAEYIIHNGAGQARTVAVNLSAFPAG